VLVVRCRRDAASTVDPCGHTPITDIRRNHSKKRIRPTILSHALILDHPGTAVRHAQVPARAPFTPQLLPALSKEQARQAALEVASYLGDLRERRGFPRRPTSCSGICRITLVIRQIPQRSKRGLPASIPTLTNCRSHPDLLRGTRPEDSAHTELVGLAFVPSRAKTALDDVDGTVWLDRATSELRFLTFHYRGPGRFAADEFTASGRVEYRNLPGVGWIVSGWRIDVPITRDVRTRAATGGEALGSTMVLSTRTTSEIGRLFQAGGEVLSTFSTASGDSVSAVRASLSGRLMEDPSGKPLRDGLVRITRRGTTEPRGATADSTGAFRFDDVVSGRNAVEAGASVDAMSPGTNTRSLRSSG
jgi:hypothetical protein